VTGESREIRRVEVNSRVALTSSGMPCTTRELIQRSYNVDQSCNEQVMNMHPLNISSLSFIPH